jgi:hypothetical protein
MRSEHTYRWVWSEGGPLIAVPESVLHSWGGAPATFPADLGDYGRACAVEDEVGVIAVGDPAVPALVFGEDPSNTTYLPDRRIFLRWYAADSEQDILAGLDAALATSEWEEGPVWVVNGPAVLFDSAYAGSRIEPRNRLRIDLESGRYRTRIAYLDIDDSTQVVAIHLVRHQEIDVV